jgi:quercetin dioxygenase-like cupin family protein
MPSGEVQVLRSISPGPELAILEGAGNAHAIVWPGMGATERSMHLLTLEPGTSTVRLSHQSECVYHVSEGTGAMEDLDSNTVHEAVTGSMLFIEPHTAYRFIAGDSGAVLLGGPCPPDPSLYEGDGHD